jgi:ABC-type lipoprotein export system ATPase subunit
LTDAFAVLRGLSKTYRTSAGGVRALRDVDASFRLGEITAVVGTSGSGKSTLLRVLAALDRPTEGSLLVDGRELGAASPGELRRFRSANVTYVAQKAADNFVPHLGIAEQAAAPERAAELLGEFGLAGRTGSRPIELSGGEQARAAFALALVRDTPLIVADEPTAELDRASAARLLEAVRAHAGRGVAFVLATHDPDVIAIADSVLQLERGRTVAPGVRRESARPAARERSSGQKAEVVASMREVSKSFKRRADTIHAVRGADLELHRGEVAALLGRSGSGKSTVLMLLSGWQSPDEGEIRYALGDGRPAGLGWHELAFLPQRFGLLPELSIRENVEYPARVAGTLDAQAASIAELLAELGLDELAARPPHETSIGQQQRAALARALALQPDVLLADEPTSHQDAEWRDRVWSLLDRAAERGTACLVATHEERVVEHAVRVWRISEGRPVPEPA